MYTPVAQFREWLSEADKTEPSYANAATLCTVDENMRPHGRIILIKEIPDEGFVFYTNLTSAKGRQLKNNTAASLCLHWKTQERQVRIEGFAEQVPDAQADAYFKGRPRGSKIGAWVSQQSEALESIETLAQEVKEHEDRFKKLEDIPRPPHWSGFLLKPDKIEFWQEGEFRLHTRELYTLQKGRWKKSLLYP